MGKCMSTPNQKSHPLDNFDKQPEDTENFKSLPLPKLGFQTMLSSVKIKSCPYSCISLKFTINNVEQFELSKKQVTNDGSVIWKIEHTVGFQMTQYQLRKQFLIVECFDMAKKQVGVITINLYTISIGPYHQDFAIKFENNRKGRISFDFRVNQIITLNLQSLRSQVELFTKHPGQKFKFSIKTIVDSHSELSRSSYSISQVFHKNIKHQTNSQLPIKKKSFNLNQICNKDQNLIWSKQQCLQMPSIMIKMRVSDLHHASFQILIWKMNEQNTGIQQTEKFELYGECFICLQRLFQNHHKIVTKNGIEIQQRQIQLRDKLWHHGKEIGIGNFKFITAYEKYLKQMQVCVRTQHGILNCTSVFDHDKEQTCAELEQLIQISEEIQLNIIQLQKSKSSKHILEQDTMQQKICNQMKKMIPLMQKSSKQSFLTYSYRSKKQLLWGQRAFINIGTKILDYLEEDNSQINQLCWLALTCIIKRGQFRINYIGFDETEKQLIQKRSSDGFLKKKVQVALLYQQFIYKLLKVALYSLNVKGLEQERKFAEIYCAYAYFRIPTFRIQLLQTICRDDDPSTSEWPQIQLNYDEDEDFDYVKIKQNSNSFSILFDWSSHFYKCLEKQQKCQSNYLDLQDILSQGKWRSRMAKRGTAFFYFIMQWINSVELIVYQSKSLQWRYFPGYNRIIKSFLIEMKQRNILQYPDALKNACTKLLANQKLLNSFVSLLLNKADIYRPLTILKTFQIIQMLFDALKQQNSKISTNFNNLMFCKAIKIVLESQFSYAISSALSLIYKYFNLFNFEFKGNISKYLLGQIFFKLYFHWSHNVRFIFYHLLLFRIHREASHLHSQDDKNIQMKHKTNQQINERYEKLLRVINETKDINYDDKKKRFNIVYEKEYFKRMKKKINGAKKIKADINIQNKENLKIKTFMQKSRNSVLLDQIKLNKNITSFQDKNKFERSHSYVHKPLVSRENVLSKGKQQTKQINISEFYNQQLHKFNHKVEDTTLTKQKKKSKKIAMLFDTKQFLMGQITQQQLSYMEIANKDFKDVNELFSRFKSSKSLESPNVVLHMPIDQKEIRPSKIDDW